MPANAAVGQKYLITIKGELSAQTILSTFWYECTGLIPIVTVQDAYTFLAAEFAKLNGMLVKFTDACPADYTCNELWVQCISPNRIAKRVVTKNIVGGDAFDAMTANVAAVVLRRGEQADRKNVSTLHVPLAVDGNNVDAGVLDPAGIKVQLALLAAEMLVTLDSGAGDTFIPVVWNPETGGLAAGKPIVTTLVEETSRVMRRRTVRLGI